MVYVNNVRNQLRDDFLSFVDEIAMGSDGDDESETDTSIGNEVISKAEGSGYSNQTDGDGQALHEATIGLSEANGETLREVVLRSSTSGLAIRITHAEINKENDFELDYELTTTKVNQ